MVEGVMEIAAYLPAYSFLDGNFLGYRHVPDVQYLTSHVGKDRWKIPQRVGRLSLSGEQRGPVHCEHGKRQI